MRKLVWLAVAVLVLLFVWKVLRIGY